MDLSDEFILECAKEVQPNKTLHNATVVYMKQLLQRYNDVLKQAGPITFDALTNWVKDILKGELVKHAISEIYKAAVKVKSNSGHQADDDDPVVISASIKAFFEYITAECIELAGIIVTDARGTEIYPWDIQMAIGNDEELSEMFGISRDMNALPVVILIPDRAPATFDLSYEFVTGFLLYSVLENAPWHLEIFNQPLTMNFGGNPEFFSHGHNIRYRKPAYNYTVEIKGKTYHFQTLDFLTGFKTAAEWYSDDYIKYLTNLKQYNKEGQSIPAEIVNIL